MTNRDILAVGTSSGGVEALIHRHLPSYSTSNLHELLAPVPTAASWSRRAQEFEKELGVVRDAIRRLDDIVAREGTRAAVVWFAKQAVVVY